MRIKGGESNKGYKVKDRDKLIGRRMVGRGKEHG